MNDMTPGTGTALALPEPRALAAMFAQPEQVDALIDRIEAEARSHAPDLTTAKGRKAIASLAYDVARSKTALDNAGKGLTDEARKQIAVVDAERRKIRDRLDTLKAEVRKPLDDWEAAEEERIAAHKRALDCFDLNRADANSTVEQVRHVLADVDAMATGEEWDEFQPIAQAKKDVALAHFGGLLIAAQKREADAAELARLRAEAEERARKDAEEAARREAEAAEARRIEAERIAAEQAEARRAEAERVEAERQKRAAAERQAAIERAAKEAEERAARAAKEREAIHARELAEAKAREERAAQAERDRIAAERRAEEAARAKREKDRAHRTRIRDEIAAAVAPYLAHNANSLADALIDGKVPHVRVAL